MTDQGAEDELVLGSEPRPRSRRVRITLALLTAVAVGALLVTFALTRSNRTPTAASSDSGTTISPSPVPVPATLPGPRPASLPPGRCRQDCRVSTTVPAPVRAAVHAAFPGATVVQVVSHYNSGEVLVDRRVIVDDGDRVVRVLLTRQSPQPVLTQHSIAQGHDVQRFRISLGANTVDIAAERLAGRTSDPASLRRLARDPRLASKG